MKLKAEAGKEKRETLLPYREKDHGGFEEEWLPHRRAFDWWYITGYLKDTKNAGRVYSYQYTVFNPTFLGKTIWGLHLAFTDMQNKTHKFQHNLKPDLHRRAISRKGIDVFPQGVLKLENGGMNLALVLDGVKLDLRLADGKGAYWHGDNGVMVMGRFQDRHQRSVYYSCPNMPTAGKVILDGSELEVAGKSWFDRQWGPFRMLHAGSYWEWFSLRFFDDEEVMLFSFPQHPYRDGTYIDKDGRARRLTDYSYSYHNLKRNGRLLYSYGWDIEIPGVKDEHYRVLPMNENQYNNRYYEIMASLQKTDGTEVGYCFVELLPGVRQDSRKYSFFHLLFPGYHERSRYGRTDLL